MTIVIPAPPVIASILQAPTETRAVEFKASFPWANDAKTARSDPKAQEILKTILAMSNLRDGGRIIIGVTNQGVAIGMDQAHLPTYDHDCIIPLVRVTGDPSPRVRLDHVSFAGCTFVVFTVESFVVAPVICCAQSYNDLEYGVLYTRTDKPETKKVTDPLELREIIDVAIDREIATFSARFQQAIAHIGLPPGTLAPTSGTPPGFEQELADIKGI